ncbi:hypothetical protein CLV84_3947 [Neolewinella xylanilytica]|uniref:Tetratricopeptide repeat protein n=1 Tax=Neolewinella xylanilytica TaxID=1514080 RepID=A0A2S6I1N4_9BACT|nr:hypothetical protein [Neolewinella xylanilytica]PPK84783.1 hypothetical protein CLV84_3947 [Neolewinella xylanilytica]
MNPEDQQDRIDAYLSGQLTDPERFEREMRTDPQLQSEMEATRMALDAIHISETNRLKRRLQKLENEAVNRQEPPQAKVVSINRKRNRSRYSYAAAATVLIVVAAYFLLRPAAQNDAVLAMAAFEPYDNIAFTITKGATAGEDRATAYIAYERAAFDEAEAAFRSLSSPSAPDRFYLAQSLLAQQKFAEAAPLFEELAGLDDFNLSQESEYYAALSRLGLGQRERAEATLQRITTDANHSSYAEAVDLLEEL